MEKGDKVKEYINKKRQEVREKRAMLPYTCFEREPPTGQQVFKEDAELFYSTWHETVEAVDYMGPRHIEIDEVRGKVIYHDK